MAGNPVHLLHALAETGTRGLTYIGNNVGEPGLGGGRLLRNGQIAKAIGSFFTSNPEAVAAAQSKSIEVQLIPQGSLAEAIRAGGAGIGGFYTPTAAGTVVAEGSGPRDIDGVPHVGRLAGEVDHDGDDGEETEQAQRHPAEFGAAAQQCPGEQQGGQHRADDRYVVEQQMQVDEIHTTLRLMVGCTSSMRRAAASRRSALPHPSR